MARKKSEPIAGLGNDKDKLLVQKSLPLFSLWQSELTLAEFKILDTYLSRINSHNPDKRTVVFEKGELEEKLGISKISKSNLEMRLKHLMSNVVEIPDSSMKHGFRLITLFEEAEAEQDENGLWKVCLECTQKAMKYFFNIEKIGYLRYKLRCVTSLTSRYTYVMFMYLESYRFRASWKVDLPELKQILNCDKEETYKEYKHFNNLILKKVQKEIHEKTDIRFSYEPIKKGRSVIAIRFTLETQKSLEPDDPNQYTLDDWLEQQAAAGDHIEFLQGACIAENNEPEFSREEINQIFQVLVMLPSDKLPSYGMPASGIEFQRYHYLAERYAAMNRAAQRNPIRHRFNYLLKLIKTDAGLE